MGPCRPAARPGAALFAVVTAALFALQHRPLFVADGGPGLLVFPAVLHHGDRAPCAPQMGPQRTESLFIAGLFHAAGNGAAGGGSALLVPSTSHDRSAS